MDLIEYWKSLAQDADLSDEEKAKVLKVLSNDKTVEGFNKEFVTRSTFSSELDKQRDGLKKQYEGHYQKWYDEKVVPELTKRDQDLVKARTQLNAFEQTYGKLDNAQLTADPDVVKTGSGDYISRKDLEALLDQRDKLFADRTASVLKTAIKVSQDYSKRFGKPLDVDAWEKYAVEHDLPPELAYKEFIQPEVEEYDKKALDERIKREREEAVKDYASRNRLPIDTKPPELSPLAASLKLEQDKVPTNDRQRYELFQEAMAEVKDEASTS